MYATGNHNLIDNNDFKKIVSSLDKRLQNFYKSYSDPKYDLWNGGTSKGTISYPDKFKRRFGDDWKLSTEMIPEFSQ